jgi:hypothetical protein
MKKQHRQHRWEVYHHEEISYHGRWPATIWWQRCRECGKILKETLREGLPRAYRDKPKTWSELMESIPEHELRRLYEGSWEEADDEG